MAMVTGIFLLIPLLVGGIVLQIFLSTRKNKWLGLILPAITFGYSLLMVLSVAVFGGMGIGEILLLVGATLLLGNIPTMVLLCIYFACRQKQKMRTRLDKMNIQDLG